MFSASLWWLWRFYIILLSYVCMSLVTYEPGDNRGHLIVKCTAAIRPNAGIFWQVLVHFCTLLHCPRSPGYYWKGRAYLLRAVERLSTFHYVEGTGRWDWEHYFLHVDAPANYLWRVSVWYRRVSMKWTTGFDFSEGTHHGHPEPLSCVFASGKHRNVKNHRFSLICLAFIAIYYFSKKEPFNVNSLQKDLYVYQEMYLLATLNI